MIDQVKRLADINDFLANGPFPSSYDHGEMCRLALKLQCREETAHALLSSEIRDFLNQGYIQVSQLFNISYQTRECLADRSNHFVIGLFSVEQILAIRMEAMNALKNPWIRDLLLNKVLPIDGLLKISSQAVKAFSNEDIQKAIANKTITIDRVLSLTATEVDVLCSPSTRALVHQVFPACTTSGHVGVAWRPEQVKGSANGGVEHFDLKHKTIATART